ncbi:ATP-dependent nuclease [Thiomicrorhabdus chilensis]|uniref:ATP-dependent nuclease n=1 Tax=Thiomicrorhabdus chilensis TaxID=63656 RepID=UPI00040D62CE|nr:AAA family ATPase [Thiomicrorhabdus chilensis]
MQIVKLDINNFRGIKSASILLPKHGVLIGDNNTGKTTILEALDLVLGPDRLNRYPPIDEHDFYSGIYLNEEPSEGGGDSPKIEIHTVITELSTEQRIEFGNYIEFWDSTSSQLYDIPDPEGVDATHIKPAIRVTFHGWYDPEEDDFQAKTFFSRSITEDDPPRQFTKKHKQICGFLYLRTVRTGRRALSLEKGSLLDIILRLNEVRPQMWEKTLKEVSTISIAEDPELGISSILESINSSLKKYVPKEWGVEPQLKLSNLTRENLRQVITAFIASGDGTHIAPYYRQGTGTINMLVLAMLSQIAEAKQNVIFAMEEPETAIPPYAQKRIIHEVQSLSSQTLFTSHSPFVLEEFEIKDTLVLTRGSEGTLERKSITLPSGVKLKSYRQNFRTRFCEGLLARKVLVAEGATEASAFPAACRRLYELEPDKYLPLEALGISIIDAGGEKHIPNIASIYKGLDKQTFSICDAQTEENQQRIEEQVELNLMHEEKGFEKLVVNGTTEDALNAYADSIDWPPHLREKFFPLNNENTRTAILEFFKSTKAEGTVADFLSDLPIEAIPEWIKSAAEELKTKCLKEIEPITEEDASPSSVLEVSFL